MKTLHINVKDVKTGDILLTSLATDNLIIFSDEVDYVWEYDEDMYFRTVEGDTFQFDLTRTVTVLRHEFNLTDDEIAMAHDGSDW